MAILAWLRSLPLRAKALVTVLGAALAVLGGSTYLSFRYWRSEALVAAEQQALLAATSVRAALDAALSYGSTSQARSTLHRLVSSSPATSARIFARDGTILLSSNPSEEGTRTPGIWIPDTAEIPEQGFVQPVNGGSTVRAFLPITSGESGTLVVSFSVENIRAAMDRGARLGIGLLLGAGVVMAVVIMTMLEREVVAPLQEVEDLLVREGQSGTGSGTTELGRIQASVEDLLAREEEVERRFEEQENLLLAQAGFAQVGELAAEMAHEFKRPLASIVTALQLFDQEYELEGTSRVVMDEVNDQLSRLTGTMQDLFSLAKPVALERERVNLAELMDDCLMEAGSHPAAESIRFVRNYDPSVPDLWAEERRLRQALTNVLVNAVEAMPEGGTITVTIQAMGDCGILFKIQDQGAGIPKEEIEKAFKPFYSTKPLGTGLGLPLVVRVVRSHRGKLGIESTPGEGTTVRICLPFYQPDAETTELCGCEAHEFSSSTTIS